MRGPVVCLAVLLVCFPTRAITAQDITWEPTDLVDTVLDIGVFFVTSTGVILAGTNFMYIDDRRGLFRSEDGMSWEEVGPTAANRIAEHPKGALFAAGWFGLHRSLDGGKTWEERLPRPHTTANCPVFFTYVGFMPDSSLRAVAWEEESPHGPGGCKFRGRALESRDAGSTWTEPQRHWGGLSAVPYMSVALSRDRLFMTDIDGHLYLSKGPWYDFERVYTVVGVRATSLAQDFSQTLYASTPRGAVRSTDSGKTWEQVNEGLADTYLTGFAAHSDGTLLVTSRTSGVFRSTDGGDTWHAVNNALPDLRTTAVMITPEGIAYLATRSGIYRSTTPVGVSTEPGAELPSDYRLGQNYPNPFNPSTTIPFTLPEAAHVTLTVYDLLGREVAVPVSGTLPAGEHTATFNAADVATGVYLYRLTAGGYMETRRMAVVR